MLMLVNCIKTFGTELLEILSTASSYNTQIILV